jgi:hypothetical protein
MKTFEKNKVFKADSRTERSLSQMPPIRLSMFQCMLTLNTDTPIKTMWRNLCRSRDKRITRMAASPPGSLQKQLSTLELQTHQIGSISLKLRFKDTNVSILIFSTHKLKISGGLQQLEFDDLTTSDFWEFIQTTLVTPCVGIVCDGPTTFTMTTGMVNANIRQNLNMQFAAYLNIVDELTSETSDTHDVYPPSCLIDATKRGRRCATKYKRTDGKGSLLFDHSGNIQAFAYRQLENLVADVTHLCSMMLPRSLTNDN